MAYNPTTGQIAAGGRIDMSTINYAFITGRGITPAASTIKAFGAIETYDANGIGTSWNVGPPPGVPLDLGYFRGRYFIDLTPSTIVYSSSGTITPPADRPTPVYMVMEVYGGGGGGGGGGGSYWKNSGQFPTIYASAAGGGGASGGYAKSIRVIYNSSVPFSILIGEGGAGGNAGTNSAVSDGDATKGGNGVNGEPTWIYYGDKRLTSGGGPSGYGGANSTDSGEPSQIIIRDAPGSGGFIEGNNVGLIDTILDYSATFQPVDPLFSSRSGSAGGVGSPGTGTPASPGYTNQGIGGNTFGSTYGKGGNGGMGGKYNVTFPTTLGVPTAGIRGNDGVAIITWNFKYDSPFVIVYISGGGITPPGKPVRFDYTLYGGAAGGGGGGGFIGTAGQSGYYIAGHGGTGESGKRVDGSGTWTDGGSLYFGKGIGGLGGGKGTRGSEADVRGGFPGSGGTDSYLSYNSVEIARAGAGLVGGGGGVAADPNVPYPPNGTPNYPHQQSYSLGGAGGQGYDTSGLGPLDPNGDGGKGGDGTLIITWYYS